MTEKMNTADLKSLSENRLGDKIVQDDKIEGLQLLREIKESDKETSV